MIWKIDWAAEDNFARDGTSDFLRIVDNYKQIRDMIYKDMGMYILIYDPIETKGYHTYAYIDLLYRLEYNLDALHVLYVEGWEENPLGAGRWAPSTPAPTFEDINRWERNGQLLERTLLERRINSLICGEFYAGNDFDDQYYEGVG